MMKTIGYIRVSTDQQDLSKQKHLLLEYAQQHKLVIDQFIEIEVSSRKSPTERRITELSAALRKGDHLLVAELSRLGRNMLETMIIITNLIDRGITLTFVRQPELSTTGMYGKLLLAIYSYIAETEREFISLRTKQGLAAVKAKGIRLGRPKGSKNKNGRVLDQCKPQIEAYLRLHLSIGAIQKLINPQLSRPLTYNSYKYYIHADSDLCKVMSRPHDL